MNDLSISITRRTELGDRAHEETIYVDLGPKRGEHIRSTIELAAEPIANPIDAPPALEWSATLCNGKRVDHATAEKACAALGEGWRLATRAELLSLVDDTRCDPAIDTGRFPDTKSGPYWTSTPLASAPSCAWIVGFYYGGASNNLRVSYLAFVRAVRSVPAGQ